MLNSFQEKGQPWSEVAFYNRLYLTENQAYEKLENAEVLNIIKVTNY